MIGEEVRRRREELGLTGAQLAAKAGMAASAVSQIETGKRTPSSTSVVKLAEALGVGVGDLYPKVPSSSLEPPLFNGAEDEPPDVTAELFHSFVSRYVDRWYEKARAGNFDIGNLDEFEAVVDDLLSTMRETEEVELGPAAGRLLFELLPLVSAAGESKLKHSELEQVRRKHAAQEAALEDIIRRGA